MPIYEYLCQDCENKFETIRGMNQADSPIECAQCHSRKTKRMLSTFNANGNFESTPRSTGGCGSCAGGSCASCHH